MGKTVVDAINDRPDVYSIYELDKETSEHVENIEINIKSPGYVMDNVAIKRMIPKSKKYCVFSKGFLEPATDRLVILMDKVCGLCGHDVPPHLKDTVPDDVIWLSDTFVMYPDKISGEEVRMVLQPYDLGFLNAIPKVNEALAYNPSLESNEYLRKKFGFDGPALATSTLVALDIVQ